MNNYPLQDYIIQYYNMGLYSLSDLKQFVDGDSLDPNEYNKIAENNK